MSTESLIEAARQLSLDERMRIADEIWASVWEEEPNLPPSREQCNELDRRLADHETNPDAGSEWKDVRARLEEKL